MAAAPGRSGSRQRSNRRCGGQVRRADRLDGSSRQRSRGEGSAPGCNGTAVAPGDCMRSMSLFVMVLTACAGAGGDDEPDAGSEPDAIMCDARWEVHKMRGVPTTAEV